MDNTANQHIINELRKYVAKFDSQNQAATSLRNVSNATVSNILNGKNLEKVSPEMWRNIANQIGIGEKWNVVPTVNYNILSAVFHDSALYANVYGIIGNASCGKTESATQYKNNNQHVFHVKCDEFWNRRTFLSEMLHAMNIEAGGYTVPDMMATAVKHIMKIKNPIIILDEFDKVSDNIWCSVVSIYNRLEGKCGILIMGTDHLERRMIRGLRLNKKGYKELFSRIGSKFIQLEDLSRSDIEQIIEANGITDPEIVAEIYNDCESDLRRVRRLVHKFKMKGGR